MKKRTLKIATLIKTLTIPLLLSGCSLDSNNNKDDYASYMGKDYYLHHHIEGHSDSIPAFVDTSKAFQLELKEEIRTLDQQQKRIIEDSLYADSVYKYLEENNITQCRPDIDGAPSIIPTMHTHSGTWKDEDGNEWPWFNVFNNNNCSICNKE